MLMMVKTSATLQIENLTFKLQGYFQFSAWFFLFY
jgi:hypothetical protein